MNYILKLLSKKALSSYEIKQKLSKKLVPEETINEIIEDCKRFGYIDDEYWIKSFIQGKIAKKQGPAAISYKLKLKGIENAKELVEEHYDVEKQTEILKELIFSKQKTLDLKNWKDKQKLLNSLQRKGFDVKIIFSAIDGS